MPALFCNPVESSVAALNGTPRGRVTRTRQPSAAADVMAGMDEEDEDSSDGASLAPPAPAPLPALSSAPTLARFVHLSHLALPHLSLVTLPRLPLPSVVSLDLSHNLLLELPPNLVLLPSLVSLNLEGNMIQSLRGADHVLPAPSLASSAAVGTPSKRLRTATGLRVLNLDHNRISNLHGLSTLLTLERLSIRHNHLSESQELHRLTVLPVLVDLYVAPQPFGALPAEDEWRVRLWEAFAREGRSEADCARVDGDGVGWSERRRMRVPFPTTSRVDGRSSGVARPVSMPKSPDIVAVSAKQSLSPALSAKDKRVSQVVEVFHSTPVASACPPPPSAFPQGLAAPKSRATPSPKPKRRKQRIVNLDGSVEGPSNGAGYESDASAVHEPPRSPAKAATDPSASASSTPATLRVPTAHSSLKLPSPSKSSHARRALSSSVYAPAPAPAPALSSSPPNRPTSPAAESGDEFRRKLEGLRSDVGDSWLRVLSAGGPSAGSGSDSQAEASRPSPEDEQEDEQEVLAVPAPAPVANAQEPPPPAAAADRPEGPDVVQVVKKTAKKKKGKKKKAT